MKYKNKISFILLPVAIFLFHVVASSQSVLALDANALAVNKSKVKANDPAVAEAYKQLLKDADKALKFAPVSVMEKKNMPPSGNKHDYMSLAPYYWPDPDKADGLPYIRKDGQTNPEVNEYLDKQYMPRLCDVVHTLSLAWYFSNEKIYAQHAALLLRIWFLDTATRMNPNLNFAQAVKGVNTGRGTGIIDTRHFIKAIDAAQLLQGSAYWTAQDHQGLKQWFAEFLTWMQTSKNGLDEMKANNNHGTWYDAQCLSMALFSGTLQAAQKIVASAQDRLDKQLDDTGMFPKEMERTLSLHYTVFVMEAFFNIARMSEKTGIDFWNYTSPSGKSLKKVFDSLYPYLAKEKQWEGQQIKAFDFENSFSILAEGKRYSCKKCKEAIETQAGEKNKRLRIHLLYY